MVKIAYLGPEGTYAEQVAIKYFGKSKRMAYSSVEEVFRATASKEADLGLVPLENIIQGPITETLDTLLKYERKLKIVDSIIIPIQHALGALPNAKIKRIMSKDQALKQCLGYINKNYKNAELVEMSSTAKAIKEISDRNLLDSAAIGGEFAIEKYGLEIIDKNIGNIKENKTKFAILGNYIPERTGEDTTSIMIYPHRDKIGLLEDIVKTISKKYKINMSNIHSRPDTKGGVRFYIDLEGHIKDARIKNCIKTLKKEIEEADIKLLGSYPRKSFIETKIKTISIIGGRGKMGQWLKDFFEEAKYNVLISGRKTPLTYKQCIKKSDVVIVNVPIKNTEEVIEKIGSYFKKGQLIVDNTSIKTQAVDKMLKSVSKDVEVLGMHTIFGPKVEKIYGQNVAFVHTSKSGERSREFENIFYKFGASIRKTDCEEHDKQMALHQNLEHFKNIVFAETIRKMFKNPAKLGDFSSPNSKNSLITMGRILSSKPEMLSEIQKYNKQSPEMIRTFLDTANKIGKGLIRHNTKKFEKSIEESIDYFGKNWIRKMVLESNKIQEKLLK